MSGHGQLTWIRFQLLLKLQWKMRFWKGGRYRRSEVEGTPHCSNNFVCCGVGVEVICHSFEVGTDFKNVFTLKIYICDPTQQKVPTFTKINFHFIAVSSRLSSTFFATICENNNFGLLASVLEGWKRGKNHIVPQNSIKNSKFFLWLIWPRMSAWPKFLVVYSILMEWGQFWAVLEYIMHIEYRSAWVLNTKCAQVQM